MSDQRTRRKAALCSSPQGKQRKKLGSILNFEKQERSYDDLHPKILKNVEKSRGFHWKQQIEMESRRSEELVRHMSYLPSYLQRGENPQEKPFNIGVLDWRLLEKWQNNHNDISPINDKNSPSTSYSSVVSKPINLAENENFQGKTGISESTKVINPSPTPQIGSGIGRIGKSSSSNLSAVKNPVCRKADSKVTSSSACLSDSTCEKSNSATRARSSPLRRLFDPFLKPKLLHRNPTRKDRSLKSSSGQTESPASHSAEVKLDLHGCRGVDIREPSPAVENGTGKVHALLQVAVKNGLPLFTFTVENCDDILAATVKEPSSKNTDCRQVYSFFSFSEMKNNAYHISQGSKSHGYISNVVAQMKVSDVPCSNSIRRRSVIKPKIREFVLSSMSTRDDETSDSLTCDELAAIVVKFPEKIGKLINQDGYVNSRDEGNQSDIAELLGVTAILPGGHHGMPSKGDPSPLIERWRSGGSCDCGGWDLGCRLRVLANSKLSSRGLNSTKSLLSNDFRLFPQEEVEEKKATLILSPYEDGIFSVEFNSSLKFIQAFSIGIAVLNSRTTVLSSPNMSGGKISEEIKSKSTKISNRSPVQVSAKYASYPPLSPAGRV